MVCSCPLGAQVMQTLARSDCGLVDEMRQIHTDYRVLWRKRDGTTTLSRGERLGAPQPPSQEESTLTLALAGFYLLSNSIHQRRFSFIIFRFALGNYFLQIARERMLLITSYRLIRKNVANARER